MVIISSSTGVIQPLHHLDECILQDVFSQFALAHAASRYRRKTLWFSSKYVERRPRLVRK